MWEGAAAGRTSRAIGLIDRSDRSVCEGFDDHRKAGLIEHEVATLIGQRVYALALGYDDPVDHDQLRDDPMLAALGGKLEARRSICAALAGKSTLNRLERSRSEPSRYHKIGHDGVAMERLFIDLFVETHATAPDQIILDLDATDDPLHGEQEGRLFHGYYQQSARHRACRTGIEIRHQCNRFRAVERARDRACNRWKRRPDGSNWGDFGADDQLGAMPPAILSSASPQAYRPRQ